MDLNEVDKHLKCPMCQYIFVKPKTIKCGHNICERCLKSYISQNVRMLGSGIMDDQTGLKPESENFECPVEACGALISPHKPYAPVRQWARGFPNNLGVVSMIELCRGRRDLLGLHCDVCRKISFKAEATSVCLSCYEKYCSKCEFLHRSTLASHVLRSIESIHGCLDFYRKNGRCVGAVDVSKDTKHCKIHLFYEIIKFCKDCSEECCEKCVETKHKECVEVQSFIMHTDEGGQKE